MKITNSNLKFYRRQLQTIEIFTADKTSQNVTRQCNCYTHGDNISPECHLPQCRIPEKCFRTFEIRPFGKIELFSKCSWTFLCTIKAYHFLQQILGGIVIGLILFHQDEWQGIREWQRTNPYYYYNNDNYHYSPTTILFMLAMAVTFFICTFILLLSCIFSLSTGGLISKTLYVSMKIELFKLSENLQWKNYLFTKS